MKCPHCGSESEGRFCTVCGGRLPSDAGGSTPADASPDPLATSVIDGRKVRSMGSADPDSTYVLSHANAGGPGGQIPASPPSDGAASTMVMERPGPRGPKPPSGGFFNSLASLSNRWPWWIVILAVIFVSVAGILGGGVSNSLQSGGFDVPGSQSVAAANQIQQATGISKTDGVIVVVHTGQPVQSATTRAEVNRVVSTLKQEPLVAQALTVFQTHDPDMVSHDGKSTYVIGEFKLASDFTTRDAAKHIYSALKSDPNVTVGGATVAGNQIADTISQDLGRAESFALPILFILLLFVFRGVVAAFFPLLMGGIAIMGAFLGLSLVNHAFWLSVFAVNMVTGLGLGLSIDYSLLISSRYREELGRNGPGLETLRRTLATSGRAVLFSSLTVTAALASLLVFPQRFLVSMAIGGILTTVIATVVALVVLPAILTLLGTRVNALAPRRWQEAAIRPASGFWYRLSKGVMRRAIIVAPVVALILIALGTPFYHIKFISADSTLLPTSLSSRQAYNMLQTRFPPHRDSPIYIAVQAPAGAGGSVQSYARSLASLPTVAAVHPPQYLGKSTWEVDVISRAYGFSDASQQLAKKIRSSAAPFPIAVGGDPAKFVDQQAAINSHLPITLLIIAVVSLIVLFLVTGSLILPIKSIIMNLLTISATFGALVWVFQDGHLENIFRFNSQNAIDVSEPILIFAVAFGLSTDYGVFLLSRIKEQHDKGMDNEEAVATGMQYTGRIVTAAAILFCVAVGAFSTSSLNMIKELGFGMALAVLIDATVVRAFLVPSLMKLLGDRNWWAPRPLRGLYERFKIEEPSYATE